jgi:hypothetical protein
MSVEDAAPATLDPANHFAGNATSAPQGAKSEPLRLERRKLHRPKRSVPATTESRANSHDDAQAGFGGQCSDSKACGAATGLMAFTVNGSGYKQKAPHSKANQTRD